MFSLRPDCDRACLRNALDQYLNAVMKHDPAAAPLFVGFRAKRKMPWSSVRAPAFGSRSPDSEKLQRRYLDPVSGQAGYFGIVEEGANTAIVTLRVKVETKRSQKRNGSSRERATRDSTALHSQVNRQATSLIRITSCERSPRKAGCQGSSFVREAMVAITNSYFDGITSHDGSIIMASPGCMRVENGATVTGRGSRGGAGGVTDCRSNLETINIQMVAARRYQSWMKKQALCWPWGSLFAGREHDTAKRPERSGSSSRTTRFAASIRRCSIRRRKRRCPTGRRSTATGAPESITTKQKEVRMKPVN